MERKIFHRTSYSEQPFRPYLNGEFPNVSRLQRKSLVGIGTVTVVGPNGPVFFDFSDADGQIGSFEVSTDLGGIVDAEGGGTWERIG